MTISYDIVAQARTWIGTPFHHQARVKRVGCDCLGLVIGVVDELQLRDADGRLLASFDEPNYPKFPDGEYLLGKLAALLSEIPAEQMQAGDLAVFHFDGNPQHLAILTDYECSIGMVHCYAPARRVIEHRLDDDWKSKIVKVYRWQP